MTRITMLSILSHIYIYVYVPTYVIYYSVIGITAIVGHYILYTHAHHPIFYDNMYYTLRVSNTIYHTFRYTYVKRAIIIFIILTRYLVLYAFCLVFLLVFQQPRAGRAGGCL